MWAAVPRRSRSHLRDERGVERDQRYGALGAPDARAELQPLSASDARAHGRRQRRARAWLGSRPMTLTRRPPAPSSATFCCSRVALVILVPARGEFAMLYPWLARGQGVRAKPARVVDRARRARDRRAHSAALHLAHAALHGRARTADPPHRRRGPTRRRRASASASGALGLALYCFALATLNFSLNGWRAKGAPRRGSSRLSALCLGVYLLVFIALAEVFSFVGVSAIFVCVSLFPIILLGHEHHVACAAVARTPAADADAAIARIACELRLQMVAEISPASVRKFVSELRRRQGGAATVDVAVDGGSGASAPGAGVAQRAKTALTAAENRQAVLYGVSLAILALNAFIIQAAAPHSQGFGILVAVAALVLDVAIVIEHSARPIVGDRAILRLLIAVCLGRFALISFGTKYWFIGHSVLYIVIAVPLVWRTVSLVMPLPDSPEESQRAALARLVKTTQQPPRRGRARRGRAPRARPIVTVRTVLLRPWSSSRGSLCVSSAASSCSRRSSPRPWSAACASSTCAASRRRCTASPRSAWSSRSRSRSPPSTRPNARRSTRGGSCDSPARASCFHGLWTFAAWLFALPVAYLVGTLSGSQVILVLVALLPISATAFVIGWHNWAARHYLVLAPPKPRARTAAAAERGRSRRRPTRPRRTPTQR